MFGGCSTGVTDATHVIYVINRYYNGTVVQGDIASLLTSDTGDAGTSPRLPEGFFNDISMTNIAIYIINHVMYVEGHATHNTNLDAVKKKLVEKCNKIFNEAVGAHMQRILQSFKSVIS